MATLNALTFVPGLNFNDMDQAGLETKANANGTVTLMTLSEFQTETGYPRPPCGSNKIVKVETASGTSLTTFTDTSIGTIDISTGVLGFFCIFGNDSGNINTNNGIRLTLGDGSLSNPANQWEPEPLAADTIANSEGSWTLCGGTVDSQDVGFPAGSPDNAAIDQAQIGVRAASGQTFTVYIAAPFYGLRSTPVIMLEQDDGNADTDIFFEDLETYGLRGAINQIATNVDGSSNTSTTAVLQAAVAKGHRVMLHGVADTHAAVNGGGQSPYRIAKGSAVGTDELPDVYALGGASLLTEQLRWELQFLQDKSLYPAMDLALPGGGCDAETRAALTSMGITSIRGTGSTAQESIYADPGKGHPSFLQVRGIAATLSDSATDLAKIDQAITHGYSMCLYYHEYAANRANVQAVFAGIQTRVNNGSLLCMPRSDWRYYIQQGITHNASLDQTKNSRVRARLLNP